MGHQIIKQPNGLYAVFSSVPDHFIMYDCTIEDLIQEEVREATERITAAVNKVTDALERGDKPYHQFTMTFDEAVEKIRRLHGEDDEDLVDILLAANAPTDRTSKE